MGHGIWGTEHEAWGMRHETWNIDVTIFGRKYFISYCTVY
jgi:hypothetical protein